MTWSEGYALAVPLKVPAQELDPRWVIPKGAPSDAEWTDPMITLLDWALCQPRGHA